MICFNAEARNAWISTNLIHVLCEAADAKLISDNKKKITKKLGHYLTMVYALAIWACQPLDGWDARFGHGLVFRSWLSCERYITDLSGVPYT